MLILILRKKEKVITYKSDGSETQIDLILLRPLSGQTLVDCKVIPGRGVLSQHRLVRANFEISEFQSRKWIGAKKLKLWKLADPGKRQEYEDIIRFESHGNAGNWNVLEKALLHAGKRVCGRTSGKRGKE